MARARRDAALPYASWPLRDRQAWTLALRAGDALGPGGPAGNWSPATRSWAINAYGQWLGWLDRRGELDTDEAPDRRVTRDRVSAYLTDMGGHLAAASIAGRIRALWRTVDVMVVDPSCTFLMDLLRRLPYGPSPAPRTVGTHDLLDLGLRLMVEAGETDARPKALARLYRDGLMIALLSLVPLRRRNFAALTLERTIMQVEGQWRIRFPGSETKSGRHIDKPVPAMLVAGLEHYLAAHRPNLPPANAKSSLHRGHLWLSTSTGAPLSAHTINLTIGSITERHFGERVNLHKFRKAAPTTLAVHAPLRMALGVAVLDHASERTTGPLYNMASAFSAAERWQATLTDIRKEQRT